MVDENGGLPSLSRNEDWEEIKKILRTVWSDCCMFPSIPRIVEYIKKNVDSDDADAFTKDERCNQNGCGKRATILDQLIKPFDPYSCHWHDGLLSETTINGSEMMWTCCRRSFSIACNPKKLRHNSFDLGSYSKGGENDGDRSIINPCRKTVHGLLNGGDYILGDDTIYIPFLVWFQRIYELGGGFSIDGNRIFPKQFREDSGGGLIKALLKIVFCPEKSDFINLKGNLKKTVSKEYVPSQDNYVFERSGPWGEETASYSFQTTRRNEHRVKEDFEVGEIFVVDLAKWGKLDLSRSFLVFALSDG